MDSTEVSDPRPRGRALAILLVLVVAGGAAWYWLPGLRASVHQKVDQVAGWNEAARRDDPVGFIDFSIQKLNENVGKFEDVKLSLATAKARLQKLHDDNQAKLAFATKQLDEFKKSWKDATAAKSFPVTVAGKAYSEADLKTQVNLLLGQRGAFENVVKQTSEGLDTTGRRETEIVARVTESKAKLSLLQTQRELVKVAKLTADSEKILGDVEEVLVQNEAAASQSPVRTVDELMKQAETASPAASANVDAFLNS